MRSLVTGVDGFIGSWLAEALIAAGDTVVGVGRRGGAAAGVEKVHCDIVDRDGVARAVRDARPDRVFHLAAINNIAQSLADPLGTVAANVGGTVNVLEALREHAPAARLVSVGSSAEYGRTSASQLRLTEDSTLAPTSPYGVTKVAQGHMCRVYTDAFGLWTAHVRPFAIIGPRKERDAISDFCKGVVAIERGASPVLGVGDLSAERDFVDVQDAVTALVTVSEKAPAGRVFNLCGGTAQSLRSVVTLLGALSARPFEVAVQAPRKRKVDDLRIVGDPTALFSLGYRPRFTLADTVGRTLTHWRHPPGSP